MRKLYFSVVSVVYVILSVAALIVASGAPVANTGGS